IVLAGLHAVCSPYGTVAENTQMMVAAIKNPWVDAIVHPGNPEYEVDAETIVKAAVEYDVALEINNSSLKLSRAGSRPYCENIACLAKEYGAKIILGTDSHFASAIGDFTKALEVVEKYKISPDLVINTSVEKLLRHLNRRFNRRNSVK
ncbi:MAG: hypothetical protein K0R78_2614, partial [Pelosinus sp.]|nr:hypothetical protein [Pelosinus sp.]